MKELVEASESIPSEKVGRLESVKLRILAFGLILVIIAIILLQFFIQLRNPPEMKLPSELRPSWTQNESLVKTMAFWGDVGSIIGGIILIIGLLLVLYGLINRYLEKRIRESEKFDTPLLESFITHLQSDKNFILVFVCTLVFGLLWIFNIMTYPPEGPLYFLRESYLQFYFPDVPLENLPSLSTYGAFAVVQDTAILLIFLYIIYVRLRPGKQLGEDFVNFAMDRTLFLVVLMSTSLYHAIGHLPFELYGRGQWGTGFTTLEAWIAFDKIGHLFASMAITMLLVAIIINQFAKAGARSEGFTLFGLVVAIAFMISLGLAWEIYEWIMNALLAMINAPSHFVDEILDAPKDLLWNAIGAIIGAILAYVDLKRTQPIEINRM